MSITPILYIILGVCLGVGASLIYLQERFTKERRKLIALNEAEKAKSADMLKRLDADWEEKTKADKEDILAKAARVQELEEALEEADNRAKNLAQETPSTAHKDGGQDNELLIDLQGAMQVKETELKDLLRENQEISKTLQTAYQEVKDLHGEITFLKGEVKKLEETSKDQPSDDDFLVLGPGNHYIPGSVARNLMARRRADE